MSFIQLWQEVKRQEPLIHCITHPITMNDSANAILAVGGRPTMASHPEEMDEAAAHDQALAVNLGNITEERMEAMRRAGRAAKQRHIPCLIDAVGAGFSTLRRTFAQKWIYETEPQIIKGNSSEILSLCGKPSHASGVDAGAADAVTRENMRAMTAVFSQYARERHAVVLVSGAVDIITDGTKAVGVVNGTPLLGRLTGTGCMLGALAATYLSLGSPWQAAVLSAAVLGIAGEIAAAQAKGMGSFHMALLDALSLLEEDELMRRVQLIPIEG